MKKYILFNVRLKTSYKNTHAYTHTHTHIQLLLVLFRCYYLCQVWLSGLMGLCKVACKLLPWNSLHSMNVIWFLQPICKPQRVRFEIKFSCSELQIRLAQKILAVNLQLIRSNISINRIYITLNKDLPSDQAFNQGKKSTQITLDYPKESVSSQDINTTEV